MHVWRPIVVGTTILVLASSAAATNWKFLGNEGYLLGRLIDLDSVRAGPSPTSIEYRVMFEKTGEVRKVIGFCSAMRRMEVLEASDEVNPVFRSVFPGTPLGRELQTACKAANQPFGGADPQAVDAPYLAAPTPGSTLPRTGPTTSEAPKPRSESVVVSGSGFVVAPGVIATNRHVIEDCDGPLKIRFDDAMYSVSVRRTRLELAGA